MVVHESESDSSGFGICPKIMKPYILHYDLYTRAITFLNNTYRLVFITNTQSVLLEKWDDVS